MLPGENSGRGIMVGPMQAAGQGWGIIRMGMKVKAEDGQQEPGNVHVDERPQAGQGQGKG